MSSNKKTILVHFKDSEQPYENIFNSLKSNFDSNFEVFFSSKKLPEQTLIELRTKLLEDVFCEVLRQTNIDVSFVGFGQSGSYWADLFTRKCKL